MLHGPDIKAGKAEDLDQGELWKRKCNAHLKRPPIDAMHLDHDNFIEAQLAPTHTVRSDKPKKKTDTISSLTEDESAIAVKLTLLQAGLDDPTITEVLKEAIQQAMTAFTIQKLEVQAKLEKLRSTRKQKKSKKVEKSGMRDIIHMGSLTKIFSDSSEDDASDGEGDNDSAPASLRQRSGEIHDVVVRWSESMSDKAKAEAQGATHHTKVNYGLLTSGADLGLKHLQAYLHEGRSIPFMFKHLMKLVPEFLPRCSYISRELALHVLTNREKKNTCIFHSFKTAGRKYFCDNNGKTVVNGVPYQPGDLESNAKKDALTCGCLIAEGLLDFIFYKVAQAESYNPQLTTVEQLDGDPLHARHRTFLAQGFQKTGLCINDLYVGEAGEFVGIQHMLSLITRMVARINSQLPEGQQVVLGLCGQDV